MKANQVKTNYPGNNYCSSYKRGTIALISLSFICQLSNENHKIMARRWCWCSYVIKVRTVPKIGWSHWMQFSIFSAHSSHVTKCRHGKNSVWIRSRLHFLQIIAFRSLSFSSFKSCLPEKFTQHAAILTVELLPMKKPVLYQSNIWPELTLKCHLQCVEIEMASC